VSPEPLYACIGALSAAVVALWRIMDRHHRDCLADRRALWLHIAGNVDGLAGHRNKESS